MTRKLPIIFLLALTVACDGTRGEVLRKPTPRGIVGQAAFDPCADSPVLRTLYVDRQGLGGVCNDQRAAGAVSETTPWCTLGAAAAAVQPGDEVIVRAGVYTEVQNCPLCNDNAVLQAVVSGEAGKCIRFTAQSGESVEITGDGGAMHGIQLLKTANGGITPRFIAVRGFRVRDVPGNCLNVRQTSDLLLVGLELTSCANGAAELHETARVVLDRANVHDNALGGWTSAVDLFRCRENNVVSNSRIWNNTDEDPRESEGHGITMDMCHPEGSALIENNVIHDNEGGCLSIFESNRATARNNTCFKNGLRAGTGEMTFLGSGHQIYNNIAVPRTGAKALNIRERADYPVDLASIRAGYNILWADTHTDLVGWGLGNRGDVVQYQKDNPGWGESTLQQDPRLAAPAQHDFRLILGSPAVDSAAGELASPIDIEGRARPRDGNGDGIAVADRGAHEL